MRVSKEFVDAIKSALPEAPPSQWTCYKCAPKKWINMYKFKGLLNFRVCVVKVPIGDCLLLMGATPTSCVVCGKKISYPDLYLTEEKSFKKRKR